MPQLFCTEPRFSSTPRFSSSPQSLDFHLLHYAPPSTVWATPSTLLHDAPPPSKVLLHRHNISSAVPRAIALLLLQTENFHGEQDFRWTLLFIISSCSQGVCHYA
ncbi:hypothetical protein KSP39_PZI011522 [Platanthera zijinensis]|uniref:Uncharacterized protein n=1 Tax=Platanthera zijinensis TaxID=2320716 RepID=A0AAP0BGU9_9ASPA